VGEALSAIDGLLERAREPGRLVEHRRFTLAREKAMEKQAKFALRDPAQHALELVQAAVWSGGRYLALESGPGSLLVAWVGGRAFHRKELEDVLDGLFAERDGVHTRPIVQLAVAANALLAKKGARISLESGDGEGGARVELRGDGTAEAGLVAGALHGTWLHARWDAGWGAGFQRGPTPEEQIVRERCQYASIPMVVGGETLFGWRGTRDIEIFGATAQIPFREDGRRGVVALHRSADGPRGYRIVVGGVWLTTVEIPEIASIPLLGVLCYDPLHRPADHADVVRDERWRALLHAVQPHATELIRAHNPLGRRYTPPVLPALSERAESSSVPVELPDPLPALSPRDPVPLAAVPDRSPHPWFSVDPERGALLREAADPARLPAPVLLLDEAQRAALLAKRPDLWVVPIGGVPDVALASRLVERASPTREIRVRWDPGEVIARIAPGSGGGAVPWSITLGDPPLTQVVGTIQGRAIRTGGRELGRLGRPIAPLGGLSIELAGFPLHAWPEDALLDAVLSASIERDDPDLLAVAIGRALWWEPAGPGLALPCAELPALWGQRHLARREDGTWLGFEALLAEGRAAGAVALRDASDLRRAIAAGIPAIHLRVGAGRALAEIERGGQRYAAWSDLGPTPDLPVRPAPGAPLAATGDDPAGWRELLDLLLRGGSQDLPAIRAATLALGRMLGDHRPSIPSNTGSVPWQLAFARQGLLPGERPEPAPGGTVELDPAWWHLVPEIRHAVGPPPADRLVLDRPGMTGWIANGQGLVLVSTAERVRNEGIPHRVGRFRSTEPDVELRLAAELGAAGLSIQSRERTWEERVLAILGAEGVRAAIVQRPVPGGAMVALERRSDGVRVVLDPAHPLVASPRADDREAVALEIFRSIAGLGRVSLTRLLLRWAASPAELASVEVGEAA
jgi:hypothetical protein